MGFSKKKSKNKAKADRNIGQKAKDKVKQRKQIEGRKAIRESKRKAAELTAEAGGQRRPKADKEDELDGLDAVDALFADENFGDGEGSESEGVEGLDGLNADGPEPSDDESSAGAFCDVDDDDDGLPQDAIEGMEETISGAKHEEELQAIKEKDPEFYKFLVENDKALLDFRAPAEDEEDEGEDETGEPRPDQQQDAGPKGKVLTMERFKRLQDTAHTSFTAFKAAMNAFHLAVRSIEDRQPGMEDDEADDGEPKKGKNKKAKSKSAKKRESNALIRIDDEATFSAVLEWSLANMVTLLRHHAGELGAKQEDGSSGKKGQKRPKSSEPAADLVDGLIDPSRFSRWPRVKVLAQIFWEETFFLLSHLTDSQMTEFVLRSASSPEALSWLWPFKSLRTRYFRKCCSLWSTASAHKVRLLAFLFIRNSAAMSLHMPSTKESGKDRDVPHLELMIKQLIKSFADVAAMGYSWRSLSTFRFMENCLVELLRIDDATAYRVGYACIRQLALVLRNACVASSQSTEKSKKKKAQQQKAMSLVGWPFIRAIYLWTKAIGSVAVLKPLAYPLSMIAMGATKTRLSSLQNYPFVYHCIRCLNRLGSSLEVFVPVSSYLLKAFNVCLQSMEKAHRKRGQNGGSLSGSKAPDLEITLRISEGQVSEVLSLEAVGSSICFLLTDHLGLLSRSPAFPEIVAPVLLHLKKFLKHCPSEPLRRQIKALQTAAETSISDVCAHREALSEVPSWKKFLMFEATTAVAKARADMLQRKASEEKARVEKENRDDDIQAPGKKKKAKKEEAKEGEGASKRALKRKRQKERKHAEREADEKAAKELKRDKATGKAKTDVVEEMDFSSAEE